jgi:hypothetical protein
MSFWTVNRKGQKEFCHGLEAFNYAAEASLNCQNFRIDDEDEQVSDQEKSCYNCRYRRWTTDSFVCLKN